ncbi:peptidoglycan/xylan/chitin deacetylase (PgdA/CDA1 family) [Nocardia tenerifensis]|uniref:Peptidoglycan/xylan/chitin deacetylase (PgdA/CDA1 family) n=1 Tax=Nocardia tenerifensis TaxID=228006 RepID=A0A318K9T0_9NOCA|nr:polysaccharide deacetylase family protein [Nocardia tenerifensis]PXX66766.1 peptidoglycan/xylan/chitin deacetylase (PgdA/CDA1 family) [Nocardia tenerifensis]
MLERGMSRRRVFGLGAAVAAGFAVTGCGTAQSDTAVAEPSSTSPYPVAGDSAVVAKTAPAPNNSPAAVVARHAGDQPQQWGVEMPGILSTFGATGKQMALTFDACGGPGNNDIDESLVNFLIAQQIPATLFLNKRWIDANQARAAQLAVNPLFELANHGVAHKPLSVTGRAAYGIAGTGSAQEAADEVWANHERLTGLVGKPPRFFRAGTAHYDDVAVAIVNELGETPVGFSINADYGATASAAKVQAAMNAAAPGAISLAHMHRPQSGTGAGMIAVLPMIRDMGFTFVHL